MIYFTLTTYAVFCVLGTLFTGFCLWRLLLRGPFIVGPAYPRFDIAYSALFLIMMLVVGSSRSKSFILSEAVAWLFLVVIFAGPRRGWPSATLVGVSEKAFMEVFNAAVSGLYPYSEERPSRMGFTHVVAMGGVELDASTSFLGSGGIYSKGPAGEVLVAQVTEAMRERLTERPQRVSRMAYFYLTVVACLSVALGVKLIFAIAELSGIR